MPNYELRERAHEDLGRIWGYIARDNPQAADQVIAAAYETFAVLAGQPQLGPKRKLGRRWVRFQPVTNYMNYLVYYEEKDGAVTILRVVHGARQKF